MALSGVFLGFGRSEWVWVVGGGVDRPRSAELVSFLTKFFDFFGI